MVLWSRVCDDHDGKQCGEHGEKLCDEHVWFDDYDDPFAVE